MTRGPVLVDFAVMTADGARGPGRDWPGSTRTDREGMSEGPWPDVGPVRSAAGRKEPPVETSALGSWCWMWTSRS